jgi:hypothetical protein
LPRESSPPKKGDKKPFHRGKEAVLYIGN